MKYQKRELKDFFIKYKNQMMKIKNGKNINVYDFQIYFYFFI